VIAKVRLLSINWKIFVWNKKREQCDCAEIGIFMNVHVYVYVGEN
jgi:hypothetical protein